MPDRKLPFRTQRGLRWIKLCLILILFFIVLVFSPSALASTHSSSTAANSGPSIHVSAGFDARYRDGNWIPVQVTLSNNGPDFTGTVAINIPAPYYSGQPATIYQVPVTLATGAQKQVTLYVPLLLEASGITKSLNVDLLDSNGNRVTRQTATLRSLGQNDLFIGLLSDLTTGLGPLNAVTLPDQTASLIIEPLSVATLPTTASALKNFDLLILDNFTTSTLSQEQLTALQSWVNQGGVLLLVGGPEWRNTLSPLPTSLLPVTINGTTTLPNNTLLLPVGSPGNGGVHEQNVDATIHAPLTVSTATPAPNSTTILSSGSTPLIVQENLARGQVCYLAFDPMLDPVVNWSHAPLLWRGLLFRTLGDQLLTQSPTIGPIPSGKFTLYHHDISGLVQTFLPNTFPSVSLILAILLGYVLVLGPIRFLIVRRFKRRDWNWRIVLASIIFFSLLSYSISLQQKGTSVISDTISLIQLGQTQDNSSLAHETTYIGIFVPSEGNFHIHIGDNSLVQPETDSFGQPTTPQQMTITPTQNGTDIDLKNVSIWTLHAIEAEQDRSIHGSLISHLTFQNGTLSGTITNTLPYALKDVYVLMNSSYVPLGTIGAGQTQHVSLSMTASSYGSDVTLAEQIASSRGLSGYSGQAPLDESQRHIAMLTALSGEGPYYCGGGTCYGPSYKIVTSNGIIISSSGGPPTIDNQDPLLLPNAPATLIGWADDPAATTSNITVNGDQAAGTQEVMLMAPLYVNYAGNVTLPSNLVMGQLVDVQSQGTNVQEQLPDIFTMTTGSVTFEFAIPSNPQLHISSATINESSNMNQIMQQTGPSSGPVSDINAAQAYLYNWQMRRWDAATINTSSITINNTHSYIGPNGRILVQFTNQDSSKGTIAFSTPTLQAQGRA
jgi:hypothetical protein